jgi:hypothetical protein
MNLLAIVFLTVILAVPPRTSHIVTGHVEGGRLLGVMVTEGEGVISFPRCDWTFTDFSCHATSTDTVMPLLDFAVLPMSTCHPVPARVIYQIDDGPAITADVGATAPPLNCVYLPGVSTWPTD